ncbi:hypothetical protein ACTWJ8_36325 [Streptomyces sp. SDT5-1]
MSMSEEERQAAVEATAEHIRSVVAVLRELDFGDTPPAVSYRAQPLSLEEEKSVAAV